MRSAPGTEAPAEAPHRLRAIRAALAFAAALLAAPPGGATTIVPPRDLGELAAGSDAVVLARAEDSRIFETASLPWTAVRFAVLETVSGEPEPGDKLEVAVPGASAAGRTFLVAGSPRFEAGSTYLLFLGRRRDGLWAPRLLAYGVLAERVGSGRRLLAPIDESREAFLLERPDGARVEPPAVYERDLLVAHLQDVARGRRAWTPEVVRAPLEASPGVPDGAGAAIPEGCTYLTDAGVPFRWRVFDSAGSLAIYANRGGDPSLASGGLDLVQKALDFWNGIPGTGLNLLFGGTRDASAVCGGRPNFILFDDPCSEIEDLWGCTGVLAYGGGSASGTHSFAGLRWATMDSWFVIVNDGAGCLGSTYYTRMLAHELGHGIGFGHFADSRALMYEYCCNAVSDLDRTCALFTYPARDPSNLRPEVSAGEDRKIALLGTSILLEGAASDDGRPAGSTLSSEWVALDGPAAPAFEDLRAPLTAAAFPESGTYLLGLLAKDGELARMAQVRVEVQVRGDSARNLVFAQGLGGYAGAVDTVIRAAAPTSDGSRSETLTAAFEDPPGSDQPAQSLIRFDGIFGTGPGKIAPGAPIRSATLELTSTNPGDGAALHRMRTPWGATVSWANFPEGGIRPRVEAQLEPDAVVEPARPGPVRIDVTEALAAWSSSPCSNHGWALLPLGLAPSSFSSSEGSRPPRLLVEVSGPGPETLVPLGAEWRYFKGRSAPPPSWR
ncbi:MAG: DNRLRE domain-containing protein, partial [Planctomycetota bacterium]